MKTRKNGAEIAEVMAYGSIGGPSITRRSIGGNRCLKKILLKKDQGILTKCGDKKSIDRPSYPRRAVLHIRHF